MQLKHSSLDPLHDMTQHNLQYCICYCHGK